MYFHKSKYMEIFMCPQNVGLLVLRIIVNDFLDASSRPSKIFAEILLMELMKDRDKLFAVI